MFLLMWFLVQGFDKMDPMFEEVTMEESFNPITYATNFLATYGWYMLGSLAAASYVFFKMQPTINKWKEAREDAKYHKDPDMALARMEAIQRARELQQRKLLEASEKALAEKKEREELKKREIAEKLEKYGSAGGHRLGTGLDDDYLPLSGGASTSSYRPPKRSKCGGGGCGK